MSVRAPACSTLHPETRRNIHEVVQVIVNRIEKFTMRCPDLRRQRGEVHTGVDETVPEIGTDHCVANVESPPEMMTMTMTLMLT